MDRFESGSTRSSEPLEDPEGFLSPYVISEFNSYMARHRTQQDGEIRNSDNWQKGMPTNRYMRSMWRHFLDVWAIWRSNSTPEDNRFYDTIIDALCALMFNVHGMLFEMLIAQGRIVRPRIRSEDVSE